MGLIPVIEYQRIPGLRVVPGIAIAAKHEVRSVLFVSKTPIEQVSTVAVDTASRTSVASAPNSPREVLPELRGRVSTCRSGSRDGSVEARCGARHRQSGAEDPSRRACRCTTWPGNGKSSPDCPLSLLSGQSVRGFDLGENATHLSQIARSRNEEHSGDLPGLRRATSDSGRTKLGDTCSRILTTRSTKPISEGSNASFPMRPNSESSTR